jgi:FkbM family methyltransferase
MLRALVPPVWLTLRHPWIAGRIRLNARRHGAYLRHGLAGYEPHIARLLLSEVGDDWTVVEVGAHIGLFSVMLAARCRRFVAFEPDPANRAALDRNLAMNGIKNAVVIEAACGSAAGRADFVTDDLGGSAGGLAATHHGDRAGGRRSVNVVRLDSLGIVPDLVKIDAEGAEDAVLAGMGALLDGPTRVLVEVGQATREAVHSRLREHGYRLFNPHAGKPQDTGTAGWHVYACR